LFALQTDIDAQARTEEIEWIVTHIATFELSSKAVFLAVNFLDRLLLQKQIPRPKLRLYTATCLSLAAKVENEFCPHLQTFIDLADGVFTEDDMVAMEIQVMQDLQWKMNATTPILYVKMFVNALAGDIGLSLTTTFVGLCTLLGPDLVIQDNEMVAIAILAVALHGRGKPAVPNELREVFERFGTEKIQTTLVAVTRIVQNVVGDQRSPIREMFSIPERGEVALLPFECPTIE
jgi:hypothetical protein